MRSSRPRPALRARRLAAILALIAAVPLPLRAESVGEVSTVWKLIGPNHKVVVEAYDDPRVEGVTCYVSRAKTGGLSGAVGLAEDLAEASIACRQVGPIRTREPLPQQEEVFSERLSVLFKRLQVVRMVDVRRNVLVYLTYSDKLIEGSPKNSITAVAVERATPIPLRR
ncbi:CreA family protein [Aromatoleum bremense]|uniref:CreA family protein n=1 Tax=Aromatoleum bremense TaxID=76115 RepID=UPI001AEBCB84|nr:CreA family protein [Aromatoleum bremense]QTQ32101.1 CreA family protein [Aromatoleum bremense]